MTNFTLVIYSLLDKLQAPQDPEQGKQWEDGWIRRFPVYKKKSHYNFMWGLTENAISHWSTECTL